MTNDLRVPAQAWRQEGAHMSYEDITPGEYVYMSNIPKGCYGQRYRLHRLVKDVPTYQVKTLVEGLTGEDTGQWFTCSVSNFCYRFKPLDAWLREQGQ